MPDSAASQPDGWRLVWADEFDAPRIDTAKWEFEVDARGGGNDELQYYTDRPENAAVREGCLVITARRETYTGPEGTRRYTSARLRTRNRGDWLYGRFEIRARLPRGRGLWPAIWMMPTDGAYGGWASSGEIDVVELVGHRPHEILGTLHHGDSFPHNVHTGHVHRLTRGDFCSEFHDFALEWEPDSFRWYVDGVLWQVQTVWHTNAAPYPAPFDRRFHLILNVAVGGRLPGNPDATSEFPQEMAIDHVRVYARS